MVTDDLFILGINGSNKEMIRKVVWAGRLSEVMTFGEAYKRLRKNKRFEKLFEHKCSPLHVKPFEEAGKFGYEHRSELHNKYETDGPQWVKDLVSKSGIPCVRLEGQKLTLRHGTPWQAFDRDCCMLLENFFFASGAGIEFDEESLEILCEAQPEKSDDITRYAVFGLMANNQANGLRGSFLKIDGDLANRFMAWLQDRSLAKHQRNDKDGPSKTPCT